MASAAAVDPAAPSPSGGDTRALGGNWASRPPNGLSPQPWVSLACHLVATGRIAKMRLQSGLASLSLRAVPASACREDGALTLPRNPPLWWAASLSACRCTPRLQSKQGRGLFWGQYQASQTTRSGWLWLEHSITTSFGQHGARGTHSLLVH